MVNGAFARAFKAEVQPVEIASALTREMDDRAAVVSRGRTVVPNVFVVDLSPHDHDRLSVYAGTLTEELSGMVREYAEEQRYTFLGGTSVELTRDDELETGLFRVHSEAKAEVASNRVCSRGIWSAVATSRSITRSTGISGLIFFASPPRRFIAERIAKLQPWLDRCGCEGEEAERVIELLGDRVDGDLVILDRIALKAVPA